MSGSSKCLQGNLHALFPLSPTPSSFSSRGPCPVPCRYALFQKRKPGGQNQWSEKLPDFVKRLEAALFNSASTKVSVASRLDWTAVPAQSVPAVPGSMQTVFVLQEEYSDFKTLEARLQDVARRLVHRPPQAPSSSQGTPGLLPNGVFDASNVQQQQQTAQQFAGQQQGIPNPQMLLNAYPGAQGLQPGQGMMPTPNTTVPDGIDMLGVKPEPVSSANGMVPLEGTAAADASSSFQRSSMAGMAPGASTMVPNSSNSMGQALMSNGAPVLIKQDAWSMASPSMVPVGGDGKQALGSHVCAATWVQVQWVVLQ